MLNALLSQIPKEEPDLKIGSLGLWVSGYTAENQMEQGDLAYLTTPTLLVTAEVAIFSSKSDTSLFDFRNFLNDIKKMYANISDRHVVEFSSRESEFSLTLTNNDLGHIIIDINYYAWTHDCQLEFEDVIDQTYLPSIIGSLEVILNRFR
jgi:hypothetical protein